MRSSWAVLAALLPVGACGGSDSIVAATSTGSVTESSAADPTSTAVPSTGESPPPPPTASTGPEVLHAEVVAEYPHATDAFTQGLLIAPDGTVYESTGLYGASELREVELDTGTVVRSVDLAGELFGEGLELVGDRLIQLTYQEHRALVWDAETFQPVGEYTYEGEGWGLCSDGNRLVMSNGSDTLTFRDIDTFEVEAEVAVTDEGSPVTMLNELACVDGSVFANVWLTDRIVRIDPDTGTVTGRLDLPGLLDPAEAEGADVLNGIAYRPDSDTFLITGKYWPTMFEVRIS